MRMFGKKAAKSPKRGGVPSPDFRADNIPAYWYSFVECVSGVKRILTEIINSECFAFCAYFSLQTAVCIGGGAKIIFVLGCRVP